MDALPLRSRSVSNFTTLRRSLTNHVVTGVAIISTILVLVPLVAIFGYLLYKGASSLISHSSRMFRCRWASQAAAWPTPSPARE